MTALEWDKVGDRRYETGVDHGVLYLPDGSAVPWNGLTSIAETRSREVKSFYIDGIKYLDHHVPGDYAAKLQAFTYPDELEDLLGTSSFAPGVYVHDQRASTFHLSYRTRVGNDLQGVDHGYKIHLLYNITAAPSDTTMTSISDSPEAQQFEWNLTGVSQNVSGIRPTSHLSLDSRLIDGELLDTIEGLLYGTDTEDPTMPDLVYLLGLVEAA